MNFDEKWISILTEDKKEKMEEFERIRFNSPSLQLAIMEYRRLEQENGRGSDIQSINDTESLQEMFLEPISNGQIDYLHKRVEQLGIDLVEAYKRIYQMHLQNGGKRFMYLVNTL